MRRRIEDYALIGDCETAALVSRAGAIEWLCWPQFGSPACFAALLGSDDSGAWSIAAAGTAKTSRRYRDNSLVLETTIEADTGVARLIDFMPVRGEASDVVRVVEGVSGSVAMRSFFCIRFDYGRLRPVCRTHEDGGFVVMAGRHAARLSSDLPLQPAGDGACETRFTITAGEQRSFLLTYFTSFEKPPRRVDARAALQETGSFWADWASRCSYAGPWRDAVLRSLVTMKALVFRPSGGIAAAPTSSLSEQRAGSGDWDYRFCWLRDATFTLLAFMHAGYTEEAEAWRDWLLRTIAGDAANVQPVYGLDGEPRLPEWEAPWLSGFNGARPVRFGNQAAGQKQFDVFGEVADALHQARRHGLKADAAVWKLQTQLAATLEDVWREPDHGIWETRGRPRLYTLSRAMIWAALDRTIQAAEAIGGDAPVDRWKTLRAAVHEETCHRGFRSALGSFVRDFESDALDASLLLLPQIGFLPIDDPRMRSTIEAIGQNLSEDGFILRVRTEEGEKAASKSAFLACCFWYADALFMAGRRAESERMFEKLMAVRNDLGLLSEEYDPGERRLMGNFPQALSHLALVNTALNLWTDDGPANRRSSRGGPS